MVPTLGMRKLVMQELHQQVTWRHLLAVQECLQEHLPVVGKDLWVTWEHPPVAWEHLVMQVHLLAAQ